MAMHRAMRRQRRYRRHGASASDYVMPFLILICIGIIFVLAFNLWRAIFSPVVSQAAYMHVVEGDAQLKVWGTDHFFDINSDTLLMQGDELKTASGARVIVEFFDGTLARVDGSSHVVFESIDDESKIPEIDLVLTEGAMWVNKVYKDTRDTVMKIEMDNLVVNADAASVFAIEDYENEIVRVKSVFDSGEGVQVDILNAEKDTVVETEQIGVAQEIVFSDQVIQRYREFKSPAVLTGISNDFEDSDWYVWNVEQDKNPQSFDKTAGGTENVGLVTVEEELVPVEEEVQAEEEDDQPEDTTEEEEETPISADLAMPKVVSVAGVTETNAEGFYVVKENPATIIGSVEGAARVTVNGYGLQRFSAGDSEWTYYANADYGLLSPGENTYEVYAYDAEGNRSEALIIKVFYEVPAPQEEELPPAEETESSDEVEQPEGL